MRCFLSHNKANKDEARIIGAQMFLAGLDVWFDEWEIQAGDSIPEKLNAGLAGFDAFVLLWSAEANRANWVRQELNSAIMRAMANNSAKIVPCVLDDTAVPPLISDRLYVDFRGDFKKGIETLLAELTGSRSRRDRLLAIQAVIAEMDVGWITHPALPPMLCCPKCGEEKLEGWQDSNIHGDYSGLRCTRCRWSDGGEV